MASNGPQALSDDQIAKLTFEEAYERLEAIVSAIEAGKIGLEQSVAEYEKGNRLLRHCRVILARAESRIQQLHSAEDGTLTPGPMESEPGRDA
jgi:exodeoxyribonuclease VII small subunit